MFLENENPTARKEWWNYLEAGIFGGGTNKGNFARLNKGQEKILLGFVEAVYFVQKYNNGLGGFVFFSGNISGSIIFFVSYI